MATSNPTTPHQHSSNTIASSSSAATMSAPPAELKILSKNALYAPLSTYLKPSTEPSSTEDVTGSSSTTTPNKKVPSNIRESSLIDFLASTSTTYETCHIFQNKNIKSGSFPKRHDHDANISQRSLGIINAVVAGTGIGTSNKVKPRKRKEGRKCGIANSVSNKRRKKRLGRVEELKQRNKGLSNNGVVQEAVVPHDILTVLNKSWNQYVQQLLHIILPPTPSSSTVLLPSSKDLFKLSTHFATIELIGANVQIIQCLSRRHLKDRRGIVVNVTKCTWHIAMIVSSSFTKNNTTATTTATNETPKKKESNEEEKQHEHKLNEKDAASTTTPQWKVRVIPKHQTSLALKIPLSLLQIKTKDEVRQLEEDENLCVVIHGSK